MPSKQKIKRTVITVTDEMREALSQYRRDGSWNDAVKRILEENAQLKKKVS